MTEGLRRSGNLGCGGKGRRRGSAPNLFHLIGKRGSVADCDWEGEEWLD